MGAVAQLGGVSAVVVNWNGESYLPACLDALSALELDEILVVDNDSSDGSLELLASRYPEVEVIDARENAGPARARNLGMRAARNRWVLAIDNDVIVCSDLLKRLAAAALERPDAAVIQPRSVFAGDAERVHYDGGGLHYAGLITLRNFYTPLAQAEGEGVVEVDVAISLCLLVDAWALLALGGYDERYFILFEDLDLSHRVRLAGRSILSVEEALVLHDEGTEGISFRRGNQYPRSRVFYHSRNRWTYLLKCNRLWTLFLAAPGILVYEAAWLCFVARQGALGEWWRGKLAALRDLPGTLELRRQTQALRIRGDRGLLRGGPLTLTPGLKQGGGASGAARVLDWVLRGWWGVVRWLVA